MQPYLQLQISNKVQKFFTCNIIKLYLTQMQSERFINECLILSFNYYQLHNMKGSNNPTKIRSHRSSKIGHLHFGDPILLWYQQWRSMDRQKIYPYNGRRCVGGHRKRPPMQRQTSPTQISHSTSSSHLTDTDIYSAGVTIMPC